MRVCPLHPNGGCSFARHGSYARATPHGLRIARWYCPEGHRTFSLLPDFLAARLPGLLADVDAAVAVAASAHSMETAADVLRGSAVTLPSGVRWLRRRVRAARQVTAALLQLGPSAATAVTSRLRAPLDLAGQEGLVGLRQLLLPRLLQQLPAPLGFRLAGRQGLGRRDDGHQHDMGPDPASGAIYAAAVEVGQPTCAASPPGVRQRAQYQRRRRSAASGAATAACRTVAPLPTCCGSSASASIARSATSMSVPS